MDVTAWLRHRWKARVKRSLDKGAKTDDDDDDEEEEEEEEEGEEEVFVVDKGTVKSRRKSPPISFCSPPGKEVAERIVADEGMVVDNANDDEPMETNDMVWAAIAPQEESL